MTRSVAKRADAVLSRIGLPGKLPACAEFDKSYRRWCQDCGDERLRYEYDLKPDDIVFDVGGYQGEWAANIYDKFGCNIHIFEPVPDYCDQIEQRFVDNDKVHVHRYGLAGNDGEFRLGILEDASSQFKSAEKTAQCEIRSISRFLSDNAISHVALLKLNIEGGEYDLLEHLIRTGEIGLFDNIQVQFHWFAPKAHARMAAIHRSLHDTHRTTYQYRFVWENWTAKAA